jgi:hypothetical protein
MPLRLRSKSLTLRAAEGFRPRIRLGRPRDDNPWEPLLETAGSLTLEGLELSQEAEVAAARQPDTAHLVYSEGASLHLARCSIRAPNGRAAIVCRGCATVQIEECDLTAAALALCVETGSGAETRVEMRATKIDILSPREAALSIWAGKPGYPGNVRLHLAGSTFQAGRILSVGALPPDLEIQAERSRFVFGEALLSFTDYPRPDHWRQCTHWQGQDNRYTPKTHWLYLEGRPGEVHDLDGWRRLWGCPEGGSQVTSQPPFHEEELRAE